MCSHSWVLVKPQFVKNGEEMLKKVCDTQNISANYLSHVCFSCLLILESEIRYSTWKKAVMKSIGWVTTQSPESGKMSLLVIIAIFPSILNSSKYLAIYTYPGCSE
jgi:hypothetical protein